MKVEHYKGPRLRLYVTSDIGIGEELRYNYGNNKLWWRQVSTNFSTMMVFNGSFLQKKHYA